MKCLIVSDLHYRLNHYDWVLKESANFDLVVIAGDLLDVGSIASPKAQITVVTKYLSKLSKNTKIIVCSGNHDLDARNPSGEKYARWVFKINDLGIPSDGNDISLNGSIFTILPWWDGPELLSKIEEHLAKDSDTIKDNWIWIYHTPSDKSQTSWDGKKFNGDENLNKWIKIYNPYMVISGHCHLSPFKNDGSWIDRVNSTWVFNPGMQIGPFPTHIILDTKLNRAAWFSLEGGEEVDLSGELTRPVPELTQMPEWI
ncbi:MAG: phosphohydrolase [Candidatus Dadabacteria bacterium]|nr:phosphohydrolase [Candidatus Dadabacteria bacterium]NIS08229.1 phosphohydrolase [Candidatus Dadabacteria bacterium]NIV41496.1 phosphohydrolase [Candidatus Dadabacteria bacterium]NIY21717.1 phosphohydrolase [Candidatus Dadabacteria bacterium]